MEHFYLEDNPNILRMDFATFFNIKSILDDRETREEFLKILPPDIFSMHKYHEMETESKRPDMTEGKWLLGYLGNCGGRVSDLIYCFEAINHERALNFLKDEEPLQIIEQPKSSEIIVNEGEKFCISCRASGYPHPEYQWFKDDEELLLEQEQILSIPYAKKEDGGTYVCKIFKRNADSSIPCLFSDPVTVEVIPWKSSNLFSLPRENSEEKQPISIKPDIKNIEANKESIQVDMGNIQADMGNIEANMENIETEMEKIQADMENNQADRENIQSKSKEYHQQNILSTKCPESEKIVIVKQPRSCGTVAQGSTPGFRCKAKASHPVKYQWYRNGRKLDGETSTKLVLPELYPDQETGKSKFTFFCKVYNEYDEINSDFATVELAESDDNTVYVAEDKIAFLIANDKYAYEEDLVTPAVDVADLSKLLKSINFKVISCRNLNLKEMRGAFEAFCKLLQEGSYVVVFFAGHGFELNGQTYLQPVDCSEDFLPEESLCKEFILQQIQETKPAVTFLLIDACRKEPPELCNGAVKKYRAPMSKNTVFGYATSFLNGAFESDERNSFFVKYLKGFITQDIRIPEIILRVQMAFEKEKLPQHPVLETSLSVARKLCDELQNHSDTTTYQLPPCFYQQRNPIQKEIQTIYECKCCFILEIKDHLDVYFNAVHVNLYMHVKEDANLAKLRKIRFVELIIPSLKIHSGVQFNNTAFNLGTNILIIKAEALELQKVQNADLKGEIKFGYEQKELLKEFSVTIEKIKSINRFFR